VYELGVVCWVRGGGVGRGVVVGCGHLNKIQFKIEEQLNIFRWLHVTDLGSRDPG
jgi:hypothetical protein